MQLKSPLGEKVEYSDKYNPLLLCSFPRSNQREELGIESDNIPFNGFDIWRAYELSWLNLKGKPLCATAKFIFPCSSKLMVESKSLKLYLNSFCQTKFQNIDEVKKTLTKDLSLATNSDVVVVLNTLEKQEQFINFPGFLLDNLDIETDCYQVNPNLLKTSQTVVEEKLYSNLLKSNCLVTGQPDWATLFIHYIGPKIDHASLLKYIISFRQHQEFHEQCVERIFIDIKKICKTSKLTIYAKYTRRGGIDINPFRSDFENLGYDFKAARQ